MSEQGISMTQDIHTTLPLRFKEGRIEEFKRLVEEMGKAIQDNEPGAKRYQFYLNDDETECVLNESYVNLEAVFAHLKGVQSKQYFQRFSIFVR